MQLANIDSTTNIKYKYMHLFPFSSFVLLFQFANIYQLLALQFLEWRVQIPSQLFLVFTLYTNI